MKYYIEFSNGEVVHGLSGEDFAKPENKDRAGRIIVTWGVDK